MQAGTSLFGSRPDVQWAGLPPSMFFPPLALYEAIRNPRTTQLQLGLALASNVLLVLPLAFEMGAVAEVGAEVSADVAVVRVTQFYDPSAGSFGPGTARALESAAHSNIWARAIDGTASGSWVAPRAASEMNWFSRIMTGRGTYTNYIEFSVSPKELANPGGIKALYSPWQQIIPGGANLAGRGAVFGQLGTNYGMYFFLGGVSGAGIGLGYYGVTR